MRIMFLLFKVPFDSMHQIDLGIMKELLRVTYFTSNDADREEMRATVQHLMSEVKVPTEHDRTSKPISMADTKSKEYKFIGLFTSVAIATEAIGISNQERPELQRLFLLLTYFYRALMLEDWELEVIQNTLRVDNNPGFTDVQDLIDNWIKEWQSTFGHKDMHYNHHVIHHALESRMKTGPLYKSSAEPFENLYGRSRMYFTKGTINVPMQIVKNSLLSEHAQHYCANCPRRLKFCPKESLRHNDTIVWFGTVSNTLLDEPLAFHLKLTFLTQVEHCST